MNDLSQGFQTVVYGLEETIKQLEAEVHRLKNSIEELNEGDGRLNYAGPFGEGLHLLVIRGLKDSHESGEEVVKNILDVKMVAHGLETLGCLFQSEEPVDDCFALSGSFAQELFLEPYMALEKSIMSLEDLRRRESRCREALEFATQKMLETKLIQSAQTKDLEAIYSIDPKKKKELLTYVFTEEFYRLLNQEMVNTIEVYFASECNLTDTANKLFLHRNTLLYRLEKIQKTTGLDLKKFSDCWKFQLAWILRKENTPELK